MQGPLLQEWLFLEKQAQINAWVQNSFFNEIDSLWMLLRYMDLPWYYFMLCAFFTVCFVRDRVVGYLYLLVASSYFTNVLKGAFDLPRPSAYLPHLDLIALGQKQGLPSGAAMGAIIIGIIWSRHLPNALGWLVGLAYIAMVSMSRVYLGVHFVTDLIGGWVVGGLLWWSFIWLERQSHLFANAKIKLTVSVLIIGSLLFYAPGGRNLMLATFAAGIALGASLPVVESSRWLRAFLAPLGVWAGIATQSFFLTGLYLSFGVYFLSAIKWGSLFRKLQRAAAGVVRPQSS